MRIRNILVSVLAAAAGTAGCNLALDGGGVPPRDGGEAPPDQGAPVVQLSVSNPNPLPNEPVLLVCTIVRGEDEGATFDFQPADGRLFVDPLTGTATFLVESSDVGAAFSFRCTATNDSGTSEPSNVVVIIASAP